EGGYVVLGGDSMLELDGEPIGKPHTAEKAARQWRAMRGRTGTLHSGHWLIDDRDPADGGTGATFGATAGCAVTFAAVSDEEIDAYVATGEPLGVAGGFTIDGRPGRSSRPSTVIRTLSSACPSPCCATCSPRSASASMTC